MPKTAPIVLFVFNRPIHTRKTLESLMANELSGESELWIYSDGPKNECSLENLKNINEVRFVIRQKPWCSKVNIIESEKNKGLARSIVEGVTDILKMQDRVIVLEDDLITSPFFLTYMNLALEKYKNNKKIMQICSYMFPIETTGLKETFFLNLTSSWGWATWNRAWKYFEPDIDKLIEVFPKKKIKKFNLDGAYDFFSFFNLQKKNKLDSWAILWYASVFLKGGICLHPSKSLIINIGHDNSGIHSHATNFFDNSLITQKINFYEENIKENLEARKRIINYFRTSPTIEFKRISFYKRLLKIFNV
jgi:hypothetical protein